MRPPEPLTVLMPVRNAESTVGAALDDLIRGLGAQDEVVVVDDGSEDGTGRVLREMQMQTPQLHVVATSGIGLVAALNLGMREASFRWIARADADDRYPLSRLRDQRAAIADGVVLITGDYRVIASGRALGEIPCALTHPFVAASLIHPQRIPHPGVLFDREAVADAGGYRSEDFPAEDLALWVRLAQRGNMVGVPTVAVDWTMGPSSVSHSRQAAQRARTSSLLKEVATLRILTGVTRDGAGRELDAYRGTRGASLRRVLLARDLRSLASMGYGGSAYEAALRSVAAHPLASAAAASRLAVGKRRRDRVRATFHPWPDPSG